jgi:uncharacterized protein (DUF58 family)
MSTIKFNPNDLHRLNRLVFALRRMPLEQISGEHKIRRLGDGYDFLDYRAYTRGDDVRKVDWNLYGRFRQLFVRVNEAPRQTAITFLVDSSRSMQFGAPRTKMQQAQLIACGLSFVALRGGDRVFVSNFSDTSGPLVGPFHGVRRHHDIVTALEQEVPAGGSELLEAMKTLAARRRHRGVIVILSDFLNLQGIEPAIQLITSAGGKVLAVQVLDDADRAVGLKPGITRLRDSESGQLLQIRIDEENLRRYRERLENIREQLERLCRRKGHQYVLADTKEDYLQVVSQALLTGAVLR